jgi:tetratricopeptide (TPR) repeat protein
VKEYDQGMAALKKHEYLTAIQRFNAALATGHTLPQERFGTSRYSVDLYDPYYGLGVAYMELGRDAEARENFRKSRESSVIEKHPEFGDLIERLRTLDQREAASRTPTPTAAVPTPEIVATPAPPLPAVPRGGSPPVRTSTPVAGRPAPDPADLAPVVEAVAAGRLADAEVALARLRARSPDAPQTWLLSTVVLGSRYLLDGRRDAALLGRARRSLEEFRRSGGSRRAEEEWLSPALRSLLAN